MENDKEPKPQSVSQATPQLVGWKFALALCTIITLLAIYFAYDYWSKWQKAESDLERSVVENQLLSLAYDSLVEELTKIENDLAIMDNPEFQRIVLEGTANAPEALAYVYWNVSTEEVYLEIKNLSGLTEGNQYQLWAMVDNKPRDAGVFDTDHEGLIKMKHVPIGATVFAVTIEPAGGRKKPSLETMQVAGNVE